MSYEQAWLDYKKAKTKLNSKFFEKIYSEIESKIINNAIEELIHFADVRYNVNTLKCNDLHEAYIALVHCENSELGKEGYKIHYNDGTIIIEGNTDVAILYGVFQLIRDDINNIDFEKINVVEIPSNPFRMLNHWDNIDGSIERGYSGNSFFFENAEIIINERTKDYARLAASIGINAVVINNVNVAAEAIEFITDRYFEKLNQLSNLLNGYGIKMYLSLDFAAAMDIGKLETTDPLNDDVIAWWEKQMKLIYDGIPNLGGFLVKADSEGRPGPFAYGRNHADGANMLANAISPYGGIIIWRCFVYNCRQDWRDRKTDRARAAYDNFITIDGQFADNVILQIKNGPMDFQVREPVNPLFGGLKNTNQILEVQIAQEYTGQQKHVCYLIPMFKEILEFRTHCDDKNDTVADIVSGRTFGNVNTGFATVCNTGNDENWTGHDLAGVNLYGFGRLAWNTSLSSEEIAREWIVQNFNDDEAVIENILKILMMSWGTYEKYTSPLGIGWMVNPNHHYGPNVDGYEYDRWGTYHRADHLGIGVDRTSVGTGYATLYKDENARMYEDIETCPMELVLFFHYVEYNHILKNNKKLIQHIYDTHFEGVQEVEDMINTWETLKNKIDDNMYSRTLDRLNVQLESAKEWRDVVNSYFYRKSMISDEKNRVIY